MSKKNWLPKALTQSLFILTLIILILPFMWTILNSVKPSMEVFVNSWWLPQTVKWGNYVTAWVKNSISLGFVNTAIVTIISLPLVLLLSAMATFALTRLKFRGNSLILYLFVAGNMLPQALILIPLFIQLQTLNILNIPYASLILVYIAFGFPFHILVQAPFFHAVPHELEEAVYMDGGSVFDVFWKVNLPLAKSGIIIGGIFQFFYSWNEYIFAHTIVQSKELRTLPLTIGDLVLRQTYVADWGSVFAGLVIALVPCFIIYVVSQKHLTRGVLMGALKG